jgi:hypothetical protein
MRKHTLTFHRIFITVMFIIAAIQSAWTQEFVHFMEVDSIPQGKAVMYIYWPNSAAFGYDFVFINDKPVSYLPLYPKGCLVYFADPGINIINSKNMRKGDLVVQVSEGEKIYIRGFYNTGTTSFRRISPVSALKDLAKCRLYEKQNILDPGNFRSVALVSVTISKPSFPDLPMLDASAFNQKVYSIMGQIVEMQKYQIDNLREITAGELKKYFSANVLYGDSLNLEPEMVILRNKYQSAPTVEINERIYPALITGSQDLMPFNGYQNDIDLFFKNPDNYSGIIAEIAQSFKTDLVAICNTNYVLSANTLGISGTIYLLTHLYLFNPDGSLLIQGHKSLTPGKDINGRKIEEFEDALNLFPYTLDLILENITYDMKGKLKKK